MNILQLSLTSPAENLALDEALLHAAEQGQGGEMLRIWESNAACVVLGAGCAVAADVDEAACAADGVPLLRRGSGGGTVLLGPGCLLYSAILAYDSAPAFRQIGPSYCHILKGLCDALAVQGLRPAGTSDLAIGTFKVSGNAQHRKRKYFLHHGTLLYDFDVGIVGRYLRMPARQPTYRQNRPDTEFLTGCRWAGRRFGRVRQAFG